MNGAGRSPLGAFFLAIGELCPASPEIAAKIAALVHLSDGGEFEQPVSSKRGVEIPEILPPPAEPPAPPLTVTAETAKVPEEVDSIVAGKVRAFRVQRTSGPAPPSPVALPALPASGPVGARELPFEPLLRPVATRAVVGSAIRRPAAIGSVDVERLADIVARRQPVSRIPRLTAWTTNVSTRVLVDRGPGMAPFTRDATDLAERIRTVAGRERTEVLRFWQTPRRVGPSARAGQPMKLPLPGTAVIALTDLGISPAGAAVRGLERDWLDFAAEIRGAGSSLVVFVPYPRRRWPVSLAESLTLVAWDRTTSLSDVRAAARRRGSQS